MSARLKLGSIPDFTCSAFRALPSISLAVQRAPYYLSDWTDAYNYRVIPATAFVFFSNVLVRSLIYPARPTFPCSTSHFSRYPQPETRTGSFFSLSDLINCITARALSRRFGWALPSIVFSRSSDLAICWPVAWLIAISQGSAHPAFRLATCRKGMIDARAGPDITDNCG